MHTISKELFSLKAAAAIAVFLTCMVGTAKAEALPRICQASLALWTRSFAQRSNRPADARIKADEFYRSVAAL